MVELDCSRLLFTKKSNVGDDAAEFAVKIGISPEHISLLNRLEVIPTVGDGLTNTVIISESSKQEVPVAVSYTRT